MGYQPDPIFLQRCPAEVKALFSGENLYMAKVRSACPPVIREPGIDSFVSQAAITITCSGSYVAGVRASISPAGQVAEARRSRGRAERSASPRSGSEGEGRRGGV
jgi:hypothetical protein